MPDLNCAAGCVIAENALYRLPQFIERIWWVVEKVPHKVRVELARLEEALGDVEEPMRVDGKVGRGKPFGNTFEYSESLGPHIGHE